MTPSKPATNIGGTATTKVPSGNILPETPVQTAIRVLREDAEAWRGMAGFDYVPASVGLQCKDRAEKCELVAAALERA